MRITGAMIEAAARKLCRLDGFYPVGEGFFGPKLPTWEAYAKTAEAALEAALSSAEPIAYLRDVGSAEDPCYVPCAAGDPGGFPVYGEPS